jgi:hypothetical protein
MTKHVVIDGRYGDRGNLSSRVFQTVWTATIKPLLTDIWSIAKSVVHLRN